MSRFHSQIIHSVRGRLTLLVLAILIPVLLLMALLIFQAYRNERAAVAQKLLGTARAVAGVIDGQVDEAKTLLKTVVASNALRANDLVALDGMLRRALANDDRWVAVLTADGQQLVNTRVPPGASLPRSQLVPEFEEAMRRGEVYVSNLRYSQAIDKRMVHVSRPVMADGELKYFVSVAILPETLAKALDVTRYAPGSVVGVVDRNGVVITRSHSPEKFVGGSATPDMVKASAEQPEGVVDSQTLEGIPVLTAFSRAECGWSVLIGMPKVELYASARRMLGWGLGSLGLLAAIGSGMAFWIGRAVVRSVDALSADAETVGRGSLPAPRSPGLAETDAVARVMQRTAGALLGRNKTLETLNRVSAGLVAEQNVEKIVQSVTDAGREISGAAFGAFFYNVTNERGESYMLYTLSGAPREAFEKFGMPRNTSVFKPTFAGEGAVRVADIRADPRYGKMAPHHGMPQGHLPVRSYLAVPVKSPTGEVLGGLFFGHPEVGVFTQEGEDVVVGLAAQAAIAIDHANLYQAVARELNAKSKAEAELRTAQQELERRVEERTTSLREAVTQMEEFSYTVSHDLRSPLRTMNSYASALVEDYGDKFDETARNYVERIRRASERMDRLTRDVLNYSRVARAQMHLGPTDVEQIVRSTVEHYSELQPTVADVRIAAPLHAVVAHEPALSQCIANLITNAAKFVKPGERPHVTVRTEKADARVRIWIEDRGIGIPPRFQGTLFRIFERMPTAESYPGTGVGLAIVRKAVERMGGACGVESDGVNGSRFWIELNAAESMPTSSPAAFEIPTAAAPTA